MSADGRINGSLAVTRTLGDHFFKKDEKLPSNKQLVSNMCSVTVNNVTLKTRFILIACDGIWDCLENQMAVDFISDKLKFRMAEHQKTG